MANAPAHQSVKRALVVDDGEGLERAADPYELCVGVQPVEQRTSSRVDQDRSGPASCGGHPQSSVRTRYREERQALDPWQS